MSLTLRIQGLRAPQNFRLISAVDPKACGANVLAPPSRSRTATALRYGTKEMAIIGGLDKGCTIIIIRLESAPDHEPPPSPPPPTGHTGQAACCMLPVYNWGSLCCRATAQGPPGAAAATRPRRPWLSLSKVTLMATGGTAAVMNSSEIRHQSSRGAEDCQKLMRYLAIIDVEQSKTTLHPLK